MIKSVLLRQTSSLNNHSKLKGQCTDVKSGCVTSVGPSLSPQSQFKKKFLFYCPFNPPDICTRMCIVQCPRAKIRSAKGSHFKEDDSALTLYELLLYICVLLYISHLTITHIWKETQLRNTYTHILGCTVPKKKISQTWLLKILRLQPGGILQTVVGWKPWW